MCSTPLFTGLQSGSKIRKRNKKCSKALNILGPKNWVSMWGGELRRGMCTLQKSRGAPGPWQQLSNGFWYSNNCFSNLLSRNDRMSNRTASSVMFLLRMFVNHLHVSYYTDYTDNKMMKIVVALNENEDNIIQQLFLLSCKSQLYGCWRTHMTLGSVCWKATMNHSGRKLLCDQTEKFLVLINYLYIKLNRLVTYVRKIRIHSWRNPHSEVIWWLCLSMWGIFPAGFGSTFNLMRKCYCRSKQREGGVKYECGKIQKNPLGKPVIVREKVTPSLLIIEQDNKPQYKKPTNTGTISNNFSAWNQTSVCRFLY